MDELVNILNSMESHAKSVNRWLAINRNNPEIASEIDTAMNPKKQRVHAEGANGVIRALDAHLFTMSNVADIIRNELVME